MDDVEPVGVSVSSLPPLTTTEDAPQDDAPHARRARCVDGPGSCRPRGAPSCRPA